LLLHQKYSEHQHIKSVYFNGARAEQEYMTHVRPVIADEFKWIKYFRLPSTSPAMAKLTRKNFTWVNNNGQTDDISGFFPPTEINLAV
jgi:hypothetical protein